MIELFIDMIPVMNTPAVAIGTGIALAGLFGAGGALAGGLLGRKKPQDFGNLRGEALRELDIGSTPQFQRLDERIQRILGQGGRGFGEDFASLANPTIRARQTRFREETAPRIASEFSKRGLGRSTQAAGAIGRSERDLQQDIDQLRASFQLLNQQQKASSFESAFGAEKGLLGSLQQQQQARAGAQVSAPLSQAAIDQSAAQQGFLGQAAGAQGGRGIGTLLSQLLGGQTSGTALQSFSLSPLAGSGSSQLNLSQIGDDQLGNLDNATLRQLFLATTSGGL